MIEINAVEPRDEKRQIAYITVDNQEFSVGNVPANLTKMEDIQAHLDRRADEFKLLIFHKQYPESDYLRFHKENMTELEAMEKWIVAGHKNKILIGYKDKEEAKPIYKCQVIEKQKLEYEHPKWISLIKRIEESDISTELKELLSDIVRTIR